MVTEDRWTRRIPGAGLLLLLFLAGALAWPLTRMRDIDHPLANQARLDLCARLGAVPELAHLRSVSYTPSDAAGGCQWHDSLDNAEVDLVLFTIRSLADAHNPPMRIDDQYRQSRDWARSVGADEFIEAGEPGQRRLRYRLRARERDVHSRQWLVEDHGVLLWIRSNTLDADAFDALAGSLRTRVRGEAGGS